MKRIIFILALLSVVVSSYAQNRHTISGYITDKNNGESIVGVNIYSKALNLGVTSNTYGFYSLTLPAGAHEISFTFIGYQSQVKSFNLNSAINHDVEFELSSVNIQEVVVTGEKNIVETTQTSMIEVPIEQIKTIPALLGEVDILKAIQSVDTSIDYLTAAQTGEDPLTISTLQKTMGRYRLPSRYRGDSPKEDA